jgi:hypothetical protein
MEIVDVEAPILTVLIEGMTTYYVVIEGAAADAIRVTVTIGETNWQTSVFPHKASGGWFLPVKAAVRKAEGLVEGDMTSISIAL